MIEIKADDGKGVIKTSGTDIDIGAELLQIIFEISKTAENRQAFLRAIAVSLLSFVDNPPSSNSVAIKIPTPSNQGEE